MGETIKNFLNGFGSVLDIAPRNDYSALVPKYSPQEALARDFESVGRDLRSAMYSVDEENKQKQP